MGQAGRVMAVALGALVAACGPGAPGSPSGQSRTEHGLESASARSELLVDHHVHAMTPASRRWLQTEAGMGPLPELDIGALLKAADERNVDQIALLSSAYFFGSQQAERHRQDLLAAENDWIAAAIEAHPERIVGFFSVNPALESAVDEMERASGRGVFSGVKLHLANSRIDLGSPAHIGRLVEVFRKAELLGLGVVIHMRARGEGYGAADARILIDEVLEKFPAVPVQIAHLAGWGGYDQATDAALAVLAEWLHAGGSKRSNVYFDLSAVVMDLPAEATRQESPGSADGRGLAWEDMKYARLVQRLRQLGLQRVLYGTDWPAEYLFEGAGGEGSGAAGYLDRIRRLVPLSEAEIGVVLANRAPWFASVRRGLPDG